jgi:negative regulator of flagellin synthesis FlgM
MKIDPTLLPQTGVETDGAVPRKPKQQNDMADAPPTGSDILIKLSPTLQSIERTLASSDINTSRIEAIKHALATGQYQISTERIAAGLINSARQALAEGD